MQSLVAKITSAFALNAVLAENTIGEVRLSDEPLVRSFAREHDLVVIADEIYEKLIFGGLPHLSLASLPEVADRVITVNGLSKCAAMTGWRVGYLAAAQEVVDRIYLLYQHIFTCLPEFAQEAALVALDQPEAVEQMRLSYEQRRDSFIARLKGLPGFRCIVPEGAFYAWAQVDYRGMDADQMAAFLLETAGVVTVPGGAYGENSKNCIRMCFAADPADLEKAADRMAAALTGGN